MDSSEVGFELMVTYALKFILQLLLPALLRSLYLPNTATCRRLIKTETLLLNIRLKKSVLWISWKNLLFRLFTSSIWTEVVNLENIGLRFILTNVDEENILIVMDYPLHWSVSSLTWTSTPYRDAFTIAKPYKRIFQVFVVTIVSILFCFVVAAYLCMLLYQILYQT